MTQPHEARIYALRLRRSSIPGIGGALIPGISRKSCDVAQAKLEAPKPDDVLKPIGGVMPLDHEDAMEMIEEFFFERMFRRGF